MEEVLHTEVEQMEHKEVLHTQVEHMEEGCTEVPVLGRRPNLTLIFLTRLQPDISYKVASDEGHFSFDAHQSPDDFSRGSLSHPVLEGKPNTNHVRARISYSRTQQLHNMDIITQCSK
jgi:hypothetical protein